MRDRVLLFLLAAVACGRELGPASPALDGGTTSPDAGADAGEDAAPVEEKVTTFPCGTTVCNVGIHACCLSSVGLACVDATKGCPVAGDAGTDAASGPPLLCGTYNNCDGGDNCCFHPDAGSKCVDSCKSGERNLCRINQDGCGEGDCVAFPQSPAPASIGRCEND